MDRMKGKIEAELDDAQSSSSSTMRFIHINEYEYMNNYVQYIILHTRIRIFISKFRQGKETRVKVS